jgi:hypothetical protein
MLALLALTAVTPLAIYRPARPVGDWLLGETTAKAELCETDNPNEIVLTNGLISRTFRLSPDCATVDFQNLMTGQTLLRAVEPEGFLQIDGAKIPIGGLVGQPDRAYLLPKWLDTMQPTPGALRFQGFTEVGVAERMPWVKRGRPSPNEAWPPKGVGLVLRFTAVDGPVKGLTADVHYELYDGIPLLAKWIELRNGTGRTLRLNSFTSESLAVVEAESEVDPTPDWMKAPLTVATDYSFGGMAMNSSNRTVYWDTDPDYTTQVNYNLQTPCLLHVRPPLGPDIDLAAGAGFSSFHAFELVHDGYDRERRGLAVRKMFRTLAPWSTENPIMLHLTSTDPKVVRTAIDQAADVGFEMIIISFSSGLDMEDVSPANLDKFKELCDYAHSKGLQMGGYSLLASRHIDDENDVINPQTHKPGGAIFGYSPCLGSDWAATYFSHIKTFLEKTGFDLLEHDGSYPGDVCASTNHPGHRGLSDSQWTQYQTIAAFYRWCRDRGIYLNVPDNYFLAGSNKTAMGYRETNWSLPREQQHVHARQNLYDGTWEKTPSMGWMMVPLVEYQGGGAAATIEPLHEHLPDYGMQLANNFGWGAQACYRGPRLYDAPETRDMVKGWVDWFKAHRAILESDVIHVKRADGRHLDCALHVNPKLETKAMAVFYNPTDQPLTEPIRLPLYYASLKNRCRISLNDGPPKEQKLESDGSLELSATVPARGCVWYLVR